MRAPSRDDLLDAVLAALAAGAHVAMTARADRFPPELDFSVVFVVVPVVLSVLAALALCVGERRVLQAACFYAWLMVLFTVPAQGLGLYWLPTALVLTLALTHPRISSDRGAAG
ncbi:MAG: hypothetical protein JWM62_261 [Frankiales bacterium]|jgi:hypothetical protein|nr:hypothetical protein [Frankiales bacterium]